MEESIECRMNVNVFSKKKKVLIFLFAASVSDMQQLALS